MDPSECTGHSHDHEHANDLGLSLRPQIDLPNVSCFNEAAAGSGRSILKLHEERLSSEPSLQSPDDDPELLLYIPFTESVSLQSITIHNASTNPESFSPRRIKLFTNRDNLDFETARELPSEQELELLPPIHFEQGTIDYPCRPAGRFQGISSITIFVVSNFGESGEGATEITFVGLKGHGTNMKRMAVNTVYETQNMSEHHRVEGGTFGSRQVL